MSTTEQLICAAKWFKEADHVLITAGAGASIEAGIDYSDRKIFAQRYPGMLQYGFSNSWEALGIMFDQNMPPELMWGYYGDHAHWMTYVCPPHTGYAKLKQCCDDKDCWVYTSNTDAMFERSGWSADRIYTPQGGFQLLQCSVPCRPDALFPALPYYEKLLPRLDHKTMFLTDPSVVPRCPHCNSLLAINARGDDSFIHDPYLPQQLKFIEWAQSLIAKKEKLLVIEIGVGSRSTPIVTRFPIESLIRQVGEENGKFIRVNLTEPQIEPGIAGLSIKSGAVEFSTKLQETYQKIKQNEITQEQQQAAEAAAMQQQKQYTLRHVTQWNWLELLERLR